MRGLEGNVHLLFPEKGGTGCEESGSSIAEQLGDECAVGDAAHMAILIFAGQALDGAHQDGDVQRFLHECIHAQLHGFPVLIGPGGDDNDWQQRGNPVKFAESRPAIPVRHVEVEQDQIRRVFNGAGHGFDAILRFVRHETFGLQNGGQAAAHKGVVVGNQYAVVNLLRGVWLRNGSRQRCAGERSSVLNEIMGFHWFIVSVFVAYPILGRLGVPFAPAMPRVANVDSQGFESEWREGQGVDGKIAYHTCDKRLTCSEQQQALWRQRGLIFKLLRQRDPATISGIALAQPSNEAPVAESSARRRSVLT
jgi:hypothetical protein